MNNNLLIIAHRGESYDAPENTLASIDLAWQRGADAVEIDVQLSKDKRIVVYHDATTMRLAGRFKRVSNQTLEELKQLDVGNHKGIKWAGERIPLLKKVLNGMPDNKHLFIEVKGKNPVAKEMKVLENLLKERNIHFIAFDLDLLAEMKREFPYVPCYLLNEKSRSVLKNSVIEKLIEKTFDKNLNGLDLDYRLLKRESDVTKIKSAGLKIFTWTVDNLEIAKRLSEWGVDGITTNRAAWLKENLLRNLKGC